jgi:hypothetical protein
VKIYCLVSVQYGSVMMEIKLGVTRVQELLSNLSQRHSLILKVYHNRNIEMCTRLFKLMISCEHGDEPSGCLNCWEFPEWLHNWQLLRKGSAPYISK